MRLHLGLNGEQVSPATARRFDGVGLVRSEYLCRQAGAWVTERSTRELIVGYLEQTARLFPGKPVWYRLVDMESNEVNTMPGCDEQIIEKTTMLGLRGVRRALRRPEALAAELGAVAAASEQHDNIHVVLPFVSDAQEVRDIVRVARGLGFRNRIGVMAEIPSAVLTLHALLDAGAQHVTLGMNDLTSLVLGTSRDLPLHRKSHPAVLDLVSRAVAVTRERGVSLSAAGYLRLDDLERLESLGVENAVVHYSHLATLWPEEFPDLGEVLDLTAIKNQVRERVNDPRIET